MSDRKWETTPVPFAKWPASLMCHDVLSPDKTIQLSPLARIRTRGEIENTTRSAVRSLDILELLARAGKPLRAIQISAALDLSPSSTHQLLKSLVDGAYLIFDPLSKRYRPSLRTTLLGSRLCGNAGVHGALAALVASLHDLLAKRIAISISQGTFMQVAEVFVAEPPNGPAEPAGIGDPFKTSIGLRVPMFGSCTGAAWLAAQSDERILSTARLCRRALDGRAGDQLWIQKIVERVRKRGYSYGGITPDDATRAVAFALPAFPDGTIHVLSVSTSAVEAEARHQTIAAIVKEQIARCFPAE